MTNPAVTQNMVRASSTLLTTSSISANAGCDTAGSISGASSSPHTFSRLKKPSRPTANSISGTSEEITWKEIALAKVSRSFSA